MLRDEYYDVLWLQFLRVYIQLGSAAIRYACHHDGQSGAMFASSRGKKCIWNPSLIEYSLHKMLIMIYWWELWVIFSWIAIWVCSINPLPPPPLSKSLTKFYCLFLSWLPGLVKPQTSYVASYQLWQVVRLVVTPSVNRNRGSFLSQVPWKGGTFSVISQITIIVMCYFPAGCNL